MDSLRGMFSSSGSSPSSSSTDSSIPDSRSAMIVQRIQQERAVNNARELVENINDVCFEKCVPKPGASLSKNEESCVKYCMEKYMAAWNTVSREYVSRIQREHNAGFPSAS